LPLIPLGRGKEALQLYDEMRQLGVLPDSVTFIALLNACSHSGMVDQALQIFASMKDFNVAQTEEHWNCVVDALSRAGKLDEAEDFITKMSNPSVTTWTALLGAC
jgi:pentatricopeptide repeat protein